MIQYINTLLNNMPTDWLVLTTHRLDIYNEAKAKYQFLDELETLYQNNNATTEALAQLPTAFDYIRLGHPLSCVLEWAIAKNNQIPADAVISFSSQTAPILAVLRKNALEKKNTRIVHDGALPANFDVEVVQNVYQYAFDILEVSNIDVLPPFDGTTLFVNQNAEIQQIEKREGIDFEVRIVDQLGSILTVLQPDYHHYISEIQHVRRRETIAMTPANCRIALQRMVGQPTVAPTQNHGVENARIVASTIKEVTGTNSTPLVGSSGLSVQYAIMMGLVHDAQEQYPNRPIKIIVPPNCYGGTNDQARRVAACLKNVAIMDLPVDGDNDMVQSTRMVLAEAAARDAVPLIIAEIPTNPRVEVPDLAALRDALSAEYFTPSGALAVPPVFILDQTFCPNVQFLGDDQLLKDVKTISYVSGSKFPSGGKCTAGYCVANTAAANLLPKIAQHLRLCDNEATDLQFEILAQQLPSMLERIAAAYKNTRDFVTFIQEQLPTAKINFVSEALAARGFTPSVFSLDLPTKGTTHEAREAHKRERNDLLINMMIKALPHESKFCVSYGQLKGCYWTIPATSTQGTTKESDKDYIVRVAVSPDLDLEGHKEVFKAFVLRLGGS